MEKVDTIENKKSKRKTILIHFAIVLGIIIVAGVLGAVTGRLILDNII